MKYLNAGFTLIELMIVVAIVGIISALAVPLYQDYVVKSQVSRAYGELAGYRAAVELHLSKSSGPVSNAELGYVPSDMTSATPGVDVATINPDGSGQLRVTLGDRISPIVAGTIIRLERNNTGVWVCIFDVSASSPRWKDNYLPRGCSI